MQDSAERAAEEFVASLQGVESEAVTVQDDPGVNLCREAENANALVEWEAPATPRTDD